MIAESRFTSVLGAVPAGDPDRIPKIARAAVTAGYAVVAVKVGSKHPACILTARQAKTADRQAQEAAVAAGRPSARVRHACGLAHAMTDPAMALRVVTRLVAQLGHVNLGLELRASRLVVVDVDTPAENAAFLADWSEATGDDETGRTFTVRSPGALDQNGAMVHRDGGHYWFELPAGVMLPTGVGVLKAASGWAAMWADRQVLIPPSVRPEGAYELIGVCEPIPSWLLDRIIQEVEAHHLRKVRQADRIFDADNDIDRWSAEHPWAEFLEPDGWIDTGLVDTCSCPVWTAPGGHASPKSATAHELGCARFDTETGSGPLHVWTDHPPAWMGATSTWTKLQYLAARDFDANLGAALAALRRAGLLRPASGPQEPEDAPAGPAVANPALVAAAGLSALPEVAEQDDDAFWLARPALTEIRAASRARLVGPWAVLGAVLAYVGARVGPHVVLPATIGGVASLNLFWALVGASGGGKDASAAVARELLGWDIEALFGAFVPTHEVGSGQGIDSAYTCTVKGAAIQFCDAALFTVTEIDSLAGHASMSGSTVLSTLRQVYTGARLGARYADKARRRPVREHRYRASVIAGVQPTRSGVLLHDHDAGTPQRWVWMPTNDPGSVDAVAAPVVAPPRFALPAHLEACGELPEGDPVTISERVELVVCARARSEIIACRRTVLAGSNVGEGDLRGHALLTQLKIAALLALYDGARTTVTDEDWDLAAMIMVRSDRTRQVCVDALAGAAREVNRGRAHQEIERAELHAEHALDRVSRTVRRHIASAGEDGILRKGLNQKVAARDREFLSPAIEGLVSRGVVTVEDLPRGQRYRLRRRE